MGTGLPRKLVTMVLPAPDVRQDLDVLKRARLYLDDVADAWSLHAFGILQTHLGVPQDERDAAIALRLPRDVHRVLLVLGKLPGGVP